LVNIQSFTSKFVGTGPSSYEKRIYRAAVSQRLRNTGVQYCEDTITLTEKTNAQAPGKTCNYTEGINMKVKEDPRYEHCPYGAVSIPLGTG